MADHVLPAVAIGLALLVASYAFVRLVGILRSGSAPGIGGPYSRQAKPVNYWLAVFKMAAIVVLCALILIRLLL
jgi:hypothetical protein